MLHGSFHSRVIDLVLQTLCLVLGRRVCREPDLHYPSWLGEDLGLLTQGGEPRRLVVPDLAVMPPSWMLTEARERTVQERIIRVDGDDPAPELVTEEVSPSTEAKDFEDNLSLHAALGIPEYLLVDTGQFKTEPHMWLFRRAETDGACHVAESGPPCACGPRLFPATCPCSSARIRRPGIGMITREALNAGGKFTPPCDCWMQSGPPCPRPTGRASKPRGRKPACLPMPCNASCPCRASPNAGGSSWQRRSHRRLRTHPNPNPTSIPANPFGTQPPRLPRNRRRAESPTGT